MLASNAVAVHQNRAVRALRRPANWVQLFKFGVVGASGYVINLIVYASLLAGRATHGRGGRARSSLSAASNYWWNRHWTFVRPEGPLRLPGDALLRGPGGACSSRTSGCCGFLDWLGLGKMVSQAIAIILVTPLNFLGNKLWSFRR